VRPIRVTVSSAAASNVIPLDQYISPFNIGLGVSLSAGASLTYTVQHTFDDVFSSTFDPATANLHGSVFDRDVAAMATKVGIQQVGLAGQTQWMETDFNQFLAVLAEYRVMQVTRPEVKHE